MMISYAMLLEICCVGLALFVASNLWFYFRVLKPIRHLAFQAEQLSQGKLNSFEQECTGISEIRQLRRAMAGMVGHVRRAQEQSRVYAEQLADGQETERKWIAHELHDDTIQSMIAITQTIEMTKNWLTSDVDRAREMLQFAREQTVETVTRLRNLIGGLRPPALEELGFIPALKMQLESLQDIDVKLTINGDPRRLDETHELALFRVAQEALRNISRHSEADAVEIEVDFQAAGVSLCIRDNGCGFHPPSKFIDLAFQKHYGLLGIHERVTNLGGTFHIHSHPGEGTTLHTYLPTGSQNQPDGLVRDPVCSALIAPQQAYGSVIFKDETYYFCCPVCQGAFQRSPTTYLINQL